MLIDFDYLLGRFDVKRRGVLHLGANKGQEASTYHRLGFNPVYWVEALPNVYLQLKEHLREFPGQYAFCACLSDVDDQLVQFHIANNEGQSSSMLEFGTHAIEHPTVRFIRDIELLTVRFYTIAQRYGLDIGPGWFLNVDLQGAELLALKGMGSYLDGFDYVYIEVNQRELYKGCPLVGEIDEYLGQRGFVGVETCMTKFGWGDKFYIRSEPKTEIGT